MSLCFPLHFPIVHRRSFEENRVNEATGFARFFMNGELIVIWTEHLVNCSITTWVNFCITLIFAHFGDISVLYNFNAQSGDNSTNYRICANCEILLSPECAAQTGDFSPFWKAISIE